MRLFASIVLLAIAAACGPGRETGGYDPNAVRMCIENTAVGYGNIVAYVNRVRFTVSPGDEVCRNVSSAAGGLSVRASSSGGGGAGPLRFSFGLPGGTYCWHWRVGNTRTLDIVSCDGALY